MAENTVVYQGTGRRKNAVARVRLVPGTGKVTVSAIPIWLSAAMIPRPRMKTLAMLASILP